MPYSLFVWDRVSAHLNSRFVPLGLLFAPELAGNLESVLHNRAALDDVGAELAAQSVHRLIQLHIAFPSAVVLVSKQRHLPALIFSCEVGKRDAHKPQRPVLFPQLPEKSLRQLIDLPCGFYRMICLALMGAVLEVQIADGYRHAFLKSR